MDEFESLKFKIYGLVGEIIRASIEKQGELEAKSLIRDLLGLQPTQTVHGKTSKQDIFLMDVFNRFAEIDTSYVHLNYIEVYIRRFPYTNSPISRSRYLQYHIGNYWNEMYILKERLHSYAKNLSRSYKKDHRYGIIKQLADLLSKNVQDTFKSITNIRGDHVHKSRYIDKDLLRIGALEHLIETSDANFVNVLSFICQREYKKIRKEWNQLIKRNNEEIRNLLNIYSDALSKILFDKNENLIYPKSFT